MATARMLIQTWWLFLGLGLAVPGQQAATGSFSSPCDSQIYCTGELLRQVQEAKLFSDDKHFVDMPLQEDPEVVLQQFQELRNATPGGLLSKQQLTTFVQRHFLPPGEELEPWEPPDWTASPSLLERISDTKLRAWAQELNALWKLLGRKMKADVELHPQRHSLIHVPEPLIVPGGRFREFYYWDSFWVIEGLLLCNLTTTVRGMIQNFLHLVERFGHIPNGGRVYYLRRSQPPFLTLMMESYLRHTNDTAFLRANIHLLEAEYRFWQEQRAVNITMNGQEYILNHYHVQVREPRPEAFSKDVELAADLYKEAQQELYGELHSGAESGWDFSSRWFLPGPPPELAELRDTQTSVVLPVDLNAVLCRVEHLLATFHHALGQTEAAGHYQSAHEARRVAMQAVLWEPHIGIWLDFNLKRRQHSRAFYPSNLTPLWAECAPPDAAPLALRYLQESTALSFTNGLPTSLARTGQQWDFPNAWAPLQHLVIAGLAKATSPQAQEMAFTLAQRWVRMNLAVFQQYQHMFEKYNVEGDGAPGSGGEYKVQEGFGWTNGVALQLLDLYGDRLTSAASLVTYSWAWIGALLVVYLG